MEGLGGDLSGDFCTDRGGGHSARFETVNVFRQFHRHLGTLFVATLHCLLVALEHFFLLRVAKVEGLNIEHELNFPWLKGIAVDHTLDQLVEETIELRVNDLSVVFVGVVHKWHVDIRAQNNSSTAIGENLRDRTKVMERTVSFCERAFAGGGRPEHGAHPFRDQAAAIADIDQGPAQQPDNAV